jgi:hypothetical protein
MRGAPRARVARAIARIRRGYANRPYRIIARSERHGAAPGRKGAARRREGAVAAGDTERDAPRSCIEARASRRGPGDLGGSHRAQGHLLVFAGEGRRTHRGGSHGTTYWGYKQNRRKKTMKQFFMCDPSNCLVLRSTHASAHTAFAAAPLAFAEFQALLARAWGLHAIRPSANAPYPRCRKASQQFDS